MVASRSRYDLPLLLALLAAAAGLWYWIFAVPAGNFWVKLAVSAIMLALSATVFSRRSMAKVLEVRLVDLPVGIASAAFLYGVFFLGNIGLTAIFPAAEAGIQNVYAPKTDLPSVAVGVVLLVATGFAEEVFWRGYVQRTLVARTNEVGGIVLGVACYAGVHAWTLNVPLMLAAAVAGTVWAVQFRLTRRLPSVILSHALWSTTIFLFAPVA